jgi:hypothetical protein
MSHRVVLTVPDHVYEHAQAMAQRQQEPVESVLVNTLRSAFPTWPVHPQREQMQREEAAFEAMREQLFVTHPGKYVAVQHGKVVDQDERELDLLQRVQARFPDQLVIVREVTPAPPPPLHFRSPRLVRDSEPL